MDIEKLIQEEAPFWNKVDAGVRYIHDEAYANALRDAYLRYKDRAREELISLWEIARQTYEPTHHSVAQCVVLYKLVQEKGERIKWIQEI